MKKNVQAFKTLTGIAIRNEIANWERIVSPMLFATTILLMFYFAFGEAESSSRGAMVIAQTFLTVFMALQLCFLRAFEPEERDGAFILLRTYPIAKELVFVTKYLSVLLFSTAVLIWGLFLANFFNQTVTANFPFLEVGLIGFLGIIGLSAIGVLMSALMLRVEAKQILFPIIYFPLTVPVLLAVTQAATSIAIEGKPMSELWRSWLGLLGIFDAVYLIIGVILFGELLKAE